MTGLSRNSGSIFSERRRCGSLSCWGFSCRTGGGRCCKVRRRWGQHQCRDFLILDSDSDWTIRGDRGCDEVLGRKKAISPCGSCHPAATSPTGTIGVSCPRRNWICDYFRWRNGGIFRVFPYLAAYVYCRIVILSAGVGLALWRINSSTSTSQRDFRCGLFPAEKTDYKR